MNRPFFNLRDKLDVDILSATTTIVVRGDTSLFPSSGMMRLDEEFISWSGKDDTTRQLTGCLRGLKGTTAQGHTAGTDLYNVVEVQENPLNLLLYLLISGGGGGAYDVLSDGLGIAESLIDIAGIEALRDNAFLDWEVQFSLYAIDNALTFFEEQILLPCGIRFRHSDDGKISIGLLDKRIFDEIPDLIDDSSIVDSPRWNVTDSLIVNQLTIEWDWDEATQQFLQLSKYEDADSRAAYGDREPINFQFKGFKPSLNGQTFIDAIGSAFIRRFKDPSPTIDLKLQVPYSELKICDKVELISNWLPKNTGDPRFSSELEVLSVAMTANGDVTARLAFTSYSGLRGAYIAPSDGVTSKIDQKTFCVAPGRGKYYEAGYVMRLWNDLTSSFEADPVNAIASISNDQITMATNWITTIQTDRHRIRFADYDECNDSQKRYAFVSNAGLPFGDGGKTYVILF